MFSWEAYSLAEARWAFDYVDYHMGTAVDTPELRSLVERLAKERGLEMKACTLAELDALWDEVKQRPQDDSSRK